jgi:RNA polymerase sigma-70 factor (ECF subfamily)
LRAAFLLVNPDAANPNPEPALRDHRWFATTHWSVVLASRDRDPERALAALERLCRTYWYPLYAYVRRHGHAPADAEDLVQGFFAQLLRRQSFQLADPHRGRFRSFLLASLNHFLADAANRASTLKRGGGQPVLSLDTEAAERHYQREASADADPERLYERRWALALLEVVLQRLEAEVAGIGQADRFAALKGALVGERSPLPYAEVGKRLGLTEAAVKMTVQRLRRRYRELVREEIAHTVSSEDEIDEEMRHLFRVLGG